MIEKILSPLTLYDKGDRSPEVMEARAAYFRQYRKEGKIRTAHRLCAGQKSFNTLYKMGDRSPEVLEARRKYDRELYRARKQRLADAATTTTVVNCFVVSMLAATSAHALTVWHPNTDPYQGTLDDAAFALIQDGASIENVMLLVDRYRHGQCMVRPIRDGEVYDKMLYGRGRVEHDVVALSSQIRARGVSNLEVVCSHVGPFVEYELLRPLACGNWSYRETELGALEGASWGGWSSVGGSGGYGIPVGWGEQPGALGGWTTPAIGGSIGAAFPTGLTGLGMLTPISAEATVAGSSSVTGAPTSLSNNYESGNRITHPPTTVVDTNHITHPPTTVVETRPNKVPEPSTLVMFLTFLAIGVLSFWKRNR